MGSAERQRATTVSNLTTEKHSKNGPRMLSR